MCTLKVLFSALQHVMLCNMSMGLLNVWTKLTVVTLTVAVAVRVSLCTFSSVVCYSFSISCH